TARKKGLDLEQVLVDELNIDLGRLGAALSKFFGVPYQPYKADRVKPIDLLKNLKREYVESTQWLPIEDDKNGLLVLCLDPERIKGSRIVNHVFPRHKLRYAVTTHQEFRDTLNLFYGAESDIGNIGELLEGLGGEEEGEEFPGASDDLSAAADNE